MHLPLTRRVGAETLRACPLEAVARALDMIHADHHGNPVFVRRNAGREAVGIETDGPMTEPVDTGGFWMS